MPYEWSSSKESAVQELRLWPHQSLSAKGFASFVFITFLMIMIPTLPLLGTALLWGLLPFVLMAVAGIYFALQANHRARQIEEVLTLDTETAQLTHKNAAGQIKKWHCNRYWAKVTKYEKDGPIPQYVTLKGDGREVEIGAFLSEDERVALFDDLQRNLPG